MRKPDMQLLKLLNSSAWNRTGLSYLARDPVEPLEIILHLARREENSWSSSIGSETGFHILEKC